MRVSHLASGSNATSTSSPTSLNATAGCSGALSEISAFKSLLIASFYVNASIQSSESGEHRLHPASRRLNQQAKSIRGLMRVNWLNFCWHHGKAQFSG